MCFVKNLSLIAGGFFFFLYLYIMEGFIKVKRVLKSTEGSERKYGFHRIRVEHIVDWREYSSEGHEPLTTISLSVRHPQFGNHVVVVSPTAEELDKKLNVI